MLENHQFAIIIAKQEARLMIVHAVWGQYLGMYV